MNKTALSFLSIALSGAAATAQAQSSVQLYGIIDTSLTFVHNATPAGQNQWSISNSNAGDLAGSRWGLRGKEDLGGSLSAIFQLENGFDPGNASLLQNKRLFGRQAFAGLTSDAYGTLTIGRQYDPVVDLVQAITADNYLGSVFATAGDVDNYDDSSRTNNSVKYLSPTYAGLQASVMYAFGGEPGSMGSGQTWSFAAAYTNGPFSVATGYFVANNTNGPRTGWGGTSDGTFDGGSINSGYITAKSIHIARLAAQYTIDKFTLGAGYSNSQYKADGFSAFHSTQKYNTGQGFATYQASPALLVGVGYSYTGAGGNTSAHYHQVSVGADYNLSKRTDVYLVGAWQRAHGVAGDGAGGEMPAFASIGSYGYPGTDSQTMASLGIRHQF